MVQAASAGPPSLRKDSTPVIANVVSLASAPAAQPTANANSVLQGTVCIELSFLQLELNSLYTSWQLTAPLGCTSVSSSSISFFSLFYTTVSIEAGYCLLLLNYVESYR